MEMDGQVQERMGQDGVDGNGGCRVRHMHTQRAAHAHATRDLISNPHGVVVRCWATTGGA